ncbi:hypothetical protein BF27_1689 [Bacillus anthracis]|nr:hypothetical protein BF27_1689 [Bacillus anthracis]
MLSALIPSAHSYPAMRPLGQKQLGTPAGASIPGPHRTKDRLLSKFPTPTTDRDRTVSRRSETQLAYRFNGRTSPTLWGPTNSPRMRMSRHRGAKPPRRNVDSWEIKACYPRGSFYPLRRWPFHAENPTGSLSPTFVPARLVGLAVKLPYASCTLRMIPNHSEETFGRPPVSVTDLLECADPDQVKLPT